MFRDMYKKGLGHEGLQEERRQKMLEQQKRRRLAMQDDQRELQVTDNDRKTRAHKRQNRRSGAAERIFMDIYGCNYTTQLSEWLCERPANLNDWLLVPCPKGQRCLLFAFAGRTEMYNKAGKLCMKFHSLLPGDGGSKGGTSLLDCIYVAAQDTFYVLDAIAYGNQQLEHCEAQFRFYWLRSRFAELEDALSERNDMNNKRIQLLEQYDFEHIDQVTTALQRFPLWPNNEPELDGFLFYHKEASYTCGSTPLVGWLFAFMVQDVLDLRVSDEYVRPADYTEPFSYMDAFSVKQEQKSKRRKPVQTVEMELETVESDTEELNCDVEHNALHGAEYKLETELTEVVEMIEFRA